MSFTLDTEYVAVNCGHDDGGCGVEFAMTRDFYRMTKKNGRYWYCPNGHRRVWGGATTEAELEKSRARETAPCPVCETEIQRASTGGLSDGMTAHFKTCHPGRVVPNVQHLPAR